MPARSKTLPPTTAGRLRSRRPSAPSSTSPAHCPRSWVRSCSSTRAGLPAGRGGSRPNARAASPPTPRHVTGLASKQRERKEQMADLDPRVRQLEEDVAILKGEVKSVLMEVRTTLLSQSNPFSNAGISAASPAAAPTVVNQQLPAPQPQYQPAQQSQAPAPPPYQESPHHEQQPQNLNGNNFLVPVPQPERQQHAPQQQPVPLPVAPRRSW